MKNKYCFLDKSQILGKTLKRFGIPSICGEINKRLLKHQGRPPREIKKYERLNKHNYTNVWGPPKKKTLKNTVPKPKIRSLKSTPRYFPVAERWSDIYLRKTKNGESKQTAETYTFAKDDNEPNQKQINIRKSQNLPNKSPLSLEKSTIIDIDPPTKVQIQSKPKPIAKLQSLQDITPINNSETGVINDPKKKYVLHKDNVKGNVKKSVRFNDKYLCTYAPTQDSTASSGKQIQDKNEKLFNEITKDVAESQKVRNTEDGRLQGDNEINIHLNKSLQCANTKQTNLDTRLLTIPLSSKEPLPSNPDVNEMVNYGSNSFSSEEANQQLNRDKTKEDLVFEIEPYSENRILIEESSHSLSSNISVENLNSRQQQKITQNNPLENTSMENEMSFSKFHPTISSGHKLEFQKTQEASKEKNYMHLGNEVLNKTLIAFKNGVSPTVEENNTVIEETPSASEEVGMESVGNTACDLKVPNPSFQNVNEKEVEILDSATPISCNNLLSRDNSNEHSDYDFLPTSLSDPLICNRETVIENLENTCGDSLTNPSSTVGISLGDQDKPHLGYEVLDKTLTDFQNNLSTTIEKNNNVIEETPSVSEEVVIECVDSTSCDMKVTNSLPQNANSENVQVLYSTPPSCNKLLPQGNSQESSEDDYVPLSLSEPLACNHETKQTVTGSLENICDNVFTNPSSIVVRTEEVLLVNQDKPCGEIETILDTFENKSPCNSESDRDYISNSSEYASDNDLEGEIQLNSLKHLNPSASYPKSNEADIQICSSNINNEIVDVLHTPNTNRPISPKKQLNKQTWQITNTNLVNAPLKNDKIQPSLTNDGLNYSNENCTSSKYLTEHNLTDLKVRKALFPTKNQSSTCVVSDTTVPVLSRGQCLNQITTKPIHILTEQKKSNTLLLSKSKRRANTQETHNSIDDLDTGVSAYSERVLTPRDNVCSNQKTVSNDLIISQKEEISTSSKHEDPYHIKMKMPISCKTRVERDNDHTNDGLGSLAEKCSSSKIITEINLTEQNEPAENLSSTSCIVSDKTMKVLRKEQCLHLMTTSSLKKVKPVNFVIEQKESNALLSLKNKRRPNTKEIFDSLDELDTGISAYSERVLTPRGNVCSNRKTVSDDLIISQKEEISTSSKHEDPDHIKMKMPISCKNRVEGDNDHIDSNNVFINKFSNLYNTDTLTANKQNDKNNEQLNQLELSQNEYSPVSSLEQLPEKRSSNNQFKDTKKINVANNHKELENANQGHCNEDKETNPQSLYNDLRRNQPSSINQEIKNLYVSTLDMQNLNKSISLEEDLNKQKYPIYVNADLKYVKSQPLYTNDGLGTLEEKCSNSKIIAEVNLIERKEPAENHSSTSCAVSDKTIKVLRKDQCLQLMTTSLKKVKPVNFVIEQKESNALLFSKNKIRPITTEICDSVDDLDTENRAHGLYGASEPLLGSNKLEGIEEKEEISNFKTHEKSNSSQFSRGFENNNQRPANILRENTSSQNLNNSLRLNVFSPTPYKTMYTSNKIQPLPTSKSHVPNKLRKRKGSLAISSMSVKAQKNESLNNQINKPISLNKFKYHKKLSPELNQSVSLENHSGNVRTKYALTDNCKISSVYEFPPSEINVEQVPTRQSENGKKTLKFGELSPTERLVLKNYQTKNNFPIKNTLNTIPYKHNMCPENTEDERVYSSYLPQQFTDSSKEHCSKENVSQDRTYNCSQEKTVSRVNYNHTNKLHWQSLSISCSNSSDRKIHSAKVNYNQKTLGSTDRARKYATNTFQKVSNKVIRSYQQTEKIPVCSIKKPFSLFKNVPKTLLTTSYKIDVHKEASLYKNGKGLTFNRGITKENKNRFPNVTSYETLNLPVSTQSKDKENQKSKESNSALHKLQNKTKPCERKVMLSARCPSILLETPESSQQNEMLKTSTQEFRNSEGSNDKLNLGNSRFEDTSNENDFYPDDSQKGALPSLDYYQNIVSNYKNCALKRKRKQIDNMYDSDYEGNDNFSQESTKRSWFGSVYGLNNQKTPMGLEECSEEDSSVISADNMESGEENNKCTSYVGEENVNNPFIDMENNLANWTDSKGSDHTSTINTNSGFPSMGEDDVYSLGSPTDIRKEIKEKPHNYLTNMFDESDSSSLSPSTSMESISTAYH